MLCSMFSEYRALPSYKPRALFQCAGSAQMTGRNAWRPVWSVLPVFVYKEVAVNPAKMAPMTS